MSYSHPIAKVVYCDHTGSVLRTKIHLSRTEGPPIAPASLWIGDPPREKDAYGVFDLHRLVSRFEDVYEFETYRDFEPLTVQLNEDTEYRFVGRWWDDQLVLAQSDPLQLKRYSFVASSPSDHDHCYLCWKTISQHEGYDHEAYTNGCNSVCLECYAKYLISGLGKLLGDFTK
jgi:hypothetical protein